MKFPNALVLFLLLSSLFALMGCTGEGIPPLPFNTSQLINQSTDLNYTLFKQGYYDLNCLGIDGNKITVKDCNGSGVVDVNWSAITGLPLGCPSGQAIQVLDDTLTCIPVGGSSADTNWQTSWTTFDANMKSTFVPYQGATTDVNLGAHSITTNNVTDTGLTASRVVYAGTNGLLSGNIGFIWDNTNARLGLNNPTPLYTLDSYTNSSDGASSDFYGSQLRMYQQFTASTNPSISRAANISYYDIRANSNSVLSGDFVGQLNKVNFTGFSNSSISNIWGSKSQVDTSLGGGTPTITNVKLFGSSGEDFMVPITNLYGFYQGTSSGATNVWGIYIQDPNAKNYFAGDVNIYNKLFVNSKLAIAEQPNSMYFTYLQGSNQIADIYYGLPNAKGVTGDVLALGDNDGNMNWGSIPVLLDYNLVDDSSLTAINFFDGNAIKLPQYTTDGCLQTTNSDGTIIVGACGGSEVDTFQTVTDRNNLTSNNILIGGTTNVVSNELVAHYLMNDSLADTVIADTTGVHNAVLGGGNTADVNGTGLINGDLFIGIDDYNADPNITNSTLYDMSISNDSAFDFGSNDFVISYWSYVAGDSGSGYGLYGEDYGIRRDIESTAMPFGIGINGGFYASSDGTNYDIANARSMGTKVYDAWTWQAVKRNGTTWTLWRDGVQSDTWESSLPMALGGGNVRVGYSNDGYPPYANFSYYDDIRFYSGSMTDDELLVIYNSGSGTENEFSFDLNTNVIGTTSTVKPKFARNKKDLFVENILDANIGYFNSLKLNNLDLNELFLEITDTPASLWVEDVGQTILSPTTDTENVVLNSSGVETETNYTLQVTGKGYGTGGGGGISVENTGINTYYTRLTPMDNGDGGTSKAWTSGFSGGGNEWICSFGDSGGGGGLYCTATGSYPDTAGMNYVTGGTTYSLYSGGNTRIDGVINDSSNLGVMDTDLRQLFKTDGGTVVMDFTDTPNDLAFISFNDKKAQFMDYIQATDDTYSISTNNRQLLHSNNTSIPVDWSGTTNTFAWLSWNSGEAIFNANIEDTSNFDSANFNTRQLFEEGGGKVGDWSTQILYEPVSTHPMIDWSNDSELLLYSTNAIQARTANGAFTGGADNTQDLGNTSINWKNLYLGNNTGSGGQIFVNTNQLVANMSTQQLFAAGAYPMIDWATWGTLKFFASNAEELNLTYDALFPYADAGLDLGKSATNEFNNGFFKSIESDAYSKAGTSGDLVYVGEKVCASTTSVNHCTTWNTVYVCDDASCTCAGTGTCASADVCGGYTSYDECTSWTTK